MRAITLQMIVFVYMFSTSVWLVDEMILKHTSIEPMGLAGGKLDPAQLETGAGEATNNFEDLRDKALNIEQDGNILDRIGQFAETGYNSVWLVLDLLTGSYFFWVLGAIGVPQPFIQVLIWIFPFFVVSQVIWFVAGRY